MLVHLMWLAWQAEKDTQGGQCPNPRSLEYLLYGKKDSGEGN